MWRVCVVWCDFDSDEAYKGREVSNACGVWNAKWCGTMDLVTSLLWRVNLIRLWECDRAWRRLSRLQTSIKPHGTTNYLLLTTWLRQTWWCLQTKLAPSSTVERSINNLILLTFNLYSRYSLFSCILGGLPNYLWFSLDYVRESCPSSLRCPSLTVQLFGTFRAQHEADVRTLRISCGRIEFMLFNSKIYWAFKLACLNQSV